MKYLKEKNYYDNLYDRFTVEECRKTEKRLSKLEYNPKGDKKIKLVTIDLSGIPIYFLTGDRYLEKEKTIREWMDRDRSRDEKLDDTPEPRNIFCSSCGSPMKVTMRDLRINYDDETRSRVLFFYDCNKCNKKRVIYEDGVGWVIKPKLCPKCNAEMSETNKREGNKIITVYNCPNCSYKKKDIFDLDIKSEKEDVDPNFEKDRKRFCLSEEEGRKYASDRENFKRIQSMVDDRKEKDKNKELYDRLAKLDKLTIVKAQSLLQPILEKEGYINLNFDQPQIERDIIVEFTVQDNKSAREEYDSKQQLRRLIKSTLENTNWRLMSEGVNYRLGILFGRLRGYENEEDLLKLLRKKHNKKIL